MECVSDLEKYAKEHLDHQAWAFYSQGAEREQTLEENLRAFTRYSLIPRMLRNSAHRDMSTTLLGTRVSFPVGLAPTGYQKLAHPQGEVAAAKAAAENGIIYTLSNVATSSIEEVSNSGSQLWFQIYPTRDADQNRTLIRRAESAGYSALVLTVDAPVIGLQRRISRFRMNLPPHLRMPNVTGVKHFQADENFDSALTWEYIDWLKKNTSLPIIIKGILTAEDAVLAVEHGASAVWVSNHGGRQLDGVPATLDVLSDVSAAVSGKCEVYMDGGIRWGSDILKALALGARAVFIGRPVLWGLAHSGKEGVNRVLNILKSELDRAMHLAGCTSISEIGPQLVQKRHFSKI